nr:unnamed protein product [Callosobruchus analis]
MISLITHPNGLRFSNVYLYCKSPYQPKYQYLRNVLQPLKDIGYFEYTEDKDIIPPNLMKPNSLIIFDDVASCPQDIIRQYFSFGRHRKTDCFICSNLYSHSKTSSARQCNTTHCATTRYFEFKTYLRRSLAWI